MTGRMLRNAQHGVDAANRKFAVYETGISASYPMERVEIDEWKVDLISILAERGALDHLSDQELAELDRGRRWLYLAVDCATRCVVGMRLAATPNSEDAYALLRDITRDKTEIAAAAGCKSAWHHFGGLGAICTDNGAAFMDDLFRFAILEAHGNPESPPTGLPHLRGRVERIFGTFGTSLMPHLAGRTFSNSLERGDYPSEHLASLHDEVLMQTLTLYVVDVYHNTPHRGLNGETPNNCWDRLSKQIGVVPKLAETTRRRAFGERDRRTANGRGIKKFGIDYACPALQHVFLHADDHEVEIRCSLEDLGWILVYVDGKWRPARALQKCFEGVSYEEWQRTARELRLRHKAEAQLHEAVVADALSKIIEINAREQARFGTVLKAQTPAGLKRARDDLFVGLSIIPEQGEEDFDLPPDLDLFGHIIPHCGEGEQSHASETSSDKSDSPSHSQRSTRWRLDDDT
ncbi:Mu transposase C-terminal domain-containing protein [Leisingera sp. M523]|uniref:Mu transposase C-terminal domain-containing protein n=1 Tax=Leisingera sp. M523 TaxID=2867013 RepID=UPI0021A293DD|nr:Mu transposase C-terminal domain-containing protein [Leisingera sp. M523]UWQ29061.1 Mu transposase C-terminal domain-containing protein [Leisingera sp. M523]